MFTHQLFEIQARVIPENVAVLDETQALSYGELDRRANQLAHRLRSLGVTPEVPVGVCMERSLDLVIGMVGLLKAGGVYVPLDPLNPKERLAFIMSETQPRVLLTQERLLNCLRDVSAPTAICLDRDWSTISTESSDLVENLTADGNLGFLIYTSGSTGEPKAVMLPHRARESGISHEQKIYQLSSNDRHVLKSSISFTLLLRELFWPLLTGGRLIISPPGTESNMDYLLGLIAEHSISIITLTPSTLRTILGQQDLERCVSLRHVICFGEALTADLVKLYFSKLSAELSVYYGATEAPSATYRRCLPSETNDVTELGQPLPRVELHLLDESLTAAPSGEIYLGGKLAHGYFKRPDLTAEKFIPHPLSNEPGARLYKTGDFGRHLADGRIEFVGRVDDLVKIRGFRVELDEITKIIRQHTEINDAFVAALETDNHRSRIVAYIVAVRPSTLSPTGLRSYVRTRLPEYMVPTRIVFLDALPVSANGKVDRKALPMPGRSRPELDTPFVGFRTPAEKDLAQIWGAALELDEVGVHDKFLDLGGDSLAATRIVSQVFARFQIKVPLQSLLQSSTVAEMASVIAQHENRKIESNELVQILDELESLSEEEAHRLMKKTLSRT